MRASASRTAVFFEECPQDVKSLWMNLCLKNPQSSTDFNSFQQARRISLKQNALKIGHFGDRPETVLGTGVRHLLCALLSVT